MFRLHKNIIDIQRKRVERKNNACFNANVKMTFQTAPDMHGCAS